MFPSQTLLFTLWVLHDVLLYCMKMTYKVAGAYGCALVMNKVLNTHNAFTTRHLSYEAACPLGERSIGLVTHPIPIDTCS